MNELRYEGKKCPKCKKWNVISNYTDGNYVCLDCGFEMFPKEKERSDFMNMDKDTYQENYDLLCHKYDGWLRKRENFNQKGELK